MQIKEGTPWASLSWTPTMNDLGTHDVVLTAEDEDGGVTKAQRNLSGHSSPRCRDSRPAWSPGRVILKWRLLMAPWGTTSTLGKLGEPVALNVKGTEYVDTQIRPGRSGPIPSTAETDWATLPFVPVSCSCTDPLSEPIGAPGTWHGGTP